MKSNQGGNMSFELILAAVVVICLGLLFFGKQLKKESTNKPSEISQLSTEVHNLSALVHVVKKDLKIVENNMVNISHHLSEIKKADTSDDSEVREDLHNVLTYLAQLRKQQQHFNSKIEGQIQTVAKGLPKMIELSVAKIKSPVPIELTRKHKDFKTVSRTRVKRINGGYEKTTVTKEVKSLPRPSMPGAKEARASLVNNELN